MIHALFAGCAFSAPQNKKRDFRRLWIERINAGVRQHGMSYSAFINQANKADVVLNRKVRDVFPSLSPCSHDGRQKIHQLDLLATPFRFSYRIEFPKTRLGSKSVCTTSSLWYYEGGVVISSREFKNGIWLTGVGRHGRDGAVQLPRCGGDGQG